MTEKRIQVQILYNKDKQNTRTKEQNLVTIKKKKKTHGRIRPDNEHWKQWSLNTHRANRVIRHMSEH